MYYTGRCCNVCTIFLKPHAQRWLSCGSLLEIGQSICLGHVLYFFVVKNFTNPAALLTPPKSFGFDTLLTVLVKVISMPSSPSLTFPQPYHAVIAVQWFFCMRIYRLSHNPIIPFIGALITLIALGFGLVVTVESLMIKVVPVFEAKVVWIVPTSLTIWLVADVYIAAALVWRLYSERNEEIQPYVMVLLLMSPCISELMISAGLQELSIN